MGWNNLFNPKLQRCSRWSLGLDKWFHLARYNGCSSLSILVKTVVACKGLSIMTYLFVSLYKELPVIVVTNTLHPIQYAHGFFVLRFVVIRSLRSGSCCEFTHNLHRCFADRTTTPEKFPRTPWVKLNGFWPYNWHRAGVSFPWDVLCNKYLRAFTAPGRALERVSFQGRMKGKFLTLKEIENETAICG